MRTDRTSATPVSRPDAIALIGFGEAGAALAEGWQDTGQVQRIFAFDIKAASRDNAVSSAMWDRYRAGHVIGADHMEVALQEADCVFSVVTADQAEAAAIAAAPHLRPDALYVDCNSCAPATKLAAAAEITRHGARYVDLAIMSPIRPDRHLSPMLVAGPHAEAACETLAGLGMTPGMAGDTIGQAAATKMLRSVIIKGIEALTLESLLAARAAGVDEAVVASLDASMPGFDWAARAAYNMERTTTHGARRAAEMHEVAATVEGLGLPARMARATAAWQQDMGDLGLAPTADSNHMTYKDRADAIRDARANIRTEETS
ncbi:NAD(P)-dependent oxidoreductase [Maritimibacter dapengensis]|uniref:DUF1932 domain-containing protein n=1 Tax=Maritimibacter dapengensis TaxID=2836868 RepID=A0ABS6T0J4_9RHOB|nr:NAD(P)-dependent oxidoreductase [Maritimibacter dapengensis]MBV7378121.1 DUF1932 domain-containing protein [Maritimibacter dapengensis]